MKTLANNVRNLDEVLKKYSDKRTEITVQTFNIIKIIKLFTWERLLYKKIKEKRKKEILVAKKKIKSVSFISLIYI